MHHDASGAGFIARLNGEAGHDVVALGLAALRRLTHRSVPASAGAVDGCGVLTAIPWPFLTAMFGGALPPGRTRAAGLLFVHPADREAAVALVSRELRAAGAVALAWRRVPTDRAAVLPAQRASMPRVLQVVAAFGAGRRSTEEAVYQGRLRIERAARQARLRLGVTSLSTATIVYKALTTPDRLDQFYPDLANPRFASRFVVFHQRFSANTSADWALAQPFRVLAHTGEINTIAGNRLWMRARLRDETSVPAGLRGEEPISTDGSDSRTLDDAVELLRHRGYSVAHALSRLVPPAWERDRELPPTVRAFYEFQSLVSEPWDGPSALCFGDGRYVGAALDRNGFRPARIVRTAAGLIAVASEVGVLLSSEHEIVDRDRLGPGEMLVVDLKRGAVMRTNEIRRHLALRFRYRQLVDDTLRPLLPDDLSDIAGPDRVRPTDAGLRPLLPDDLSDVAGPDRVRPTDAGPTFIAGPDRVRPTNAGPTFVGRTLSGPPAVESNLAQLQAAFGCTREEIEPMIAGSHEAAGATPVTNPPVDPSREPSVISLTTLIGGHGSFLNETAPRPPRIALRSPIVTDDHMARFRAASAFNPYTIAIVFDVAAGGDGRVALERRLTAVVDEACGAVQNGCALLILSDRGVDAGRAAIPALQATSAVHQALVARGLRMRASLVVETGDARDANQLAALCACGASAVCPWLAFDTVASIAPPDPTGCAVPQARYRLALERGLRTVLSKTGVCTFSGYCGAQVFDDPGPHRDNRPPTAVRDLLEFTPRDPVGAPSPESRRASELVDTMGPQTPLVVTGDIANTDRAFGVSIAGAIAERFGDAGLPDGSVQLTMTGSAGQGFGAFALPGMRLVLVGDANDGLGKGMHGGEIVVAPPARERGRTGQVLAGNAALSGAIGGRVFIAGRAGERFAVRNSGAVAVVEGVGDHACEGMTGGLVVVLGTIGRNFASGMTGGVAYVSDLKHTLVVRTNAQQVAIAPLAVAEQKIVRDLIEAHERLTGSRLARAILRNDRNLTTFRRVRGSAESLALRHTDVARAFQASDQPSERVVNE